MLKAIGEEIWRYTPARCEGQRVAIVGGMHGDEAQSIRLLKSLIDPKHPFWNRCINEVTLILGNPAAIALGRREGPNGLDLNRSFGRQTDVPERTASIQGALEGVNVVLDLHQTHRPIEVCAVCPDRPAHLQLATRLGAIQAVTGTEALYGPTMLSDWVNAQGQIGITLETGQSGDETAFVVAKEAVRRLLSTSEQFTPQQPLRVWQVLEALPAPGPGYAFARDFINGSLVQKGDLIASSGVQELRASANGALFLPRLGQESGAPCCVLVTERR